MIRKFSFPFLSLVFVGIGCTSACTTSPGVRSSSERTSASDSVMIRNSDGTMRQIQKLWMRPQPGFVSDLDISRDGSAILMATVPNYDLPGGDQKNFVSLLDSDGKRLWKKEMATAVKSQAISADGKLAVVVTYDDQILGFSRSGEAVFRTEGNCRPYILNRTGKVLCYHDDDPEPSVGFEVFDREGKRVFTYPTTRDVVVIRISEDEKAIVVALTGGQVLIFGPEFKDPKEIKVAGEIVDLDVSAASGPGIAVLYTPLSSSEKNPTQAAALYDHAGRLKTGFTPPLDSVANQIRLEPDRPAAAVFANSEKGQYLAYLSFEAKGSRQWHRFQPEGAHYSPTLLLAQEQLMVATEIASANGLDKRYRGFDRSGKLIWEIQLDASEGAYFYGEGYAPFTRTLLVATDDGILSAYRL